MSEETDTKSDSGIGIVMPQDFHSDALLELDCGKSLRDLNIRYETYGTLNMDATNAILVEHALTGDAHLAGRHSENDRKPGWWDEMVGPGRPVRHGKILHHLQQCPRRLFRHDRPGSINPDTGEPYRMNFPVITIQDMVRAQKLLIDYLGIKKLLAVVGGSMGGMLATQWGDFLSGNGIFRNRDCDCDSYSCTGDRFQLGRARGNHGGPDLEQRQLQGTAPERVGNRADAGAYHILERGVDAT